ncbi:hypothetical protein JW926_04705 [Candidatus Sumerlaeota bacterium]|nr:hypothetical protein [Candidatus Sumerlaeota bacterium]
MIRRILLILFLTSAVFGEESVSFYVNKAQSYIQSLKTGKAEIINESYGPEGDQSTAPSTFTKRVWKISYAFDREYRATRMDRWIVTEVILPASNGFPEEDAIGKSSHVGTIEGMLDLLLYQGDMEVRILPVLNRGMEITQKSKKNVEHYELRHPAFWTDSFIRVIGNMDERKFKFDRSKNYMFGEDSLHNGRQVVIQNERLIRTGNEPSRDSYTHIVHQFWVNKDFGGIEKIEASRSFLSSTEVEIVGETFNALKKTDLKNYPTEIEIVYQKSPIVPFPVEIIKTDYFPKMDKNNQLVITVGNIDKYYFDKIQINPPDFGVSDFFIYPENNTEIEVYPERTKISSQEYLNLFSHLPVEKDKIVIKNKIFMP